MPIRPFQTRYLGYWLLLGLLVLAAWLKLATPLITVLFSLFILHKLNFGGRKLIAAILFVILVSGIFYSFGYFIKEAVVALPNIAEDSLQRFLAYARERNIPLPADVLEATDPAKNAKAETIRLVKEWVQDKAGYLGNFAKILTKEFAFLLIGIVVAVSIFLS